MKSVELNMNKNNEKYKYIQTNGIIDIINKLDKNNIDKEFGINEVSIFIASIAHEIKTPMNGLLGYLQLLQRTNLNETQSQYVNSMQHCSIQLMQIINDILDFSKLSSGKMSLSPECFSPSEIEKDVNDILGKNIQEKKQKLRYILENNPKYIIMDKNKLIQIIVNLISNANKFTQIGGTIDVTIKSDIENNILNISVKDNGNGISKENIPLLFNTFTQLNKNDQYHGTGLGLAITKKIVNLLNGNINVYSELGNGSNFIINIPYKDINNYQNDIKQDIIKLKGKKILVVDDNVDNRILLSELLFEWKMYPIVCSSPLEAYRLILGNHYDFSLGLIDICMNEMSGIELARKIKIERPLFPLIALSSLDTNFSNWSDFECKLDKPINDIRLFNEIYKIITNKKKELYLCNDSFSDDSSSTCSPSSIFNKDIKILIADDNYDNCRMLEKMLNELGYNNVDSVNNGFKAINSLLQSYKDNNPYELLLLDLLMPEMNGHDVIKKLNDNINLYNLKIIVITASVMDEDKEKCKKNGIKYFLTKPIEMSQLNQILLHCCEKL
jgi:two-component system sensor histidine kinase/response regulator